MVEEEEEGLLRERRAEFTALERRLHADGYVARVTCLVAPVQIEGRLPTGEVFYFRCRWSSCSLEIGARKDVASVDPPSDEEVDAVLHDAAWRGAISRWGQYEAGGLDAEEVEPVLRGLVARYRASGATD